MLFRLLILLAAVAPHAFADVEFTSPSAGATAVGGQLLQIAWKDSGTSPPITELQSFQLFLCAGGNDAGSFIQLTSLVTNGVFSSGSSSSGTVPVSIGAGVKNAYFLKMISAGTGGTVTNYSNRFSLSGMTGTFPATVTTGLSGLSGTNGPATENNFAAAGANAAAAGGSVAAGATVPYTLQTGPIRYAPMQGKPGTKITAKNATPQYPTSSVSIAQTWLPTPEAITTQTVSATYSTSSHANTAAAAPGPMNDMQKYLARWRD
ncbi:MAG: hypothetical protein ALECFALPRED_005863 [Alectoria fallacina]|uniref:Uncharacterized protein n=1 Tax=Alectoria fallacina TaxID=1903189 RepID=A0A8H3G050_9LECA|nr:MAG: hypothetical protein ALECFALPRED_005863 [Alectoria fallacina]